ncbi:CaiB/BaiF CoA transferase family protein [Microbacterium sp. zg.Y909]|uniref:CaiB/BaiF CoA transferase family protein n=1 Tax=Microbacterium sp. zg.Y909 TaxID=2969413 RepID=UPI00214C255F|nr:CoA transferase [Microbacterium sp. zg.Y909]MCR2824070.1 CoA transferase [Microbacterium sp. zg.Y909]
MSDSVGTGPLDGVRVLDLSTTLSGPYCTRVMADFGAEVIKVEAPGGDITRDLGTPRQPGPASVYVGVNRDKPSVTLDLKDPGDRALLDRLIRHADALVHNMRATAAARLGIDAAAVRAVNPRMIHLGITGYGSNGPYAHHPAYDDTIQASSGLAWLQSLNQEEPTYVTTAVADKTTGLLAASALIAALYRRTSTGSGEAIEVPMFETMAGFALTEQWGGRAFIPPAGPTDYSRQRSPHRKPYRALDGVVSVLVYTEAHWQRFLAAVGHGHLLTNPAYATVRTRNQNIDRLYRLVAEQIGTRTIAQCLELCERLDIPAAEVKSLDDLFDDEHLRAVGFFQQFDTEQGRYLGSRSSVLWGTPPPIPAQRAEPPRRDGSATVQRWLFSEGALS